MSMRKNLFAAAVALPALALAMPALAAHSAQRASYLHKSAQAGSLANGEVGFSGNRITIPVAAGVPGTAQKRFDVHGQVNPTIVVPAGARLRFELGNASPMPHGLAVTRKAPPYPANVKSEIKPPIAGTGYVNPDGSKKKLHVGGTGWFTLKPGTYYYVCPVPTHAHDGMYGKLIVKSSGS